MNPFYFYSIGQINFAKLIFEQQFEQNSKDFQSLVGLSLCNLKLHNYKQAIQNLILAQQIDSNNFESLFLLIQAYFNDGQFNTSIKLVKDALIKFKQNENLINILKQLEQKTNIHLNLTNKSEISFRPENSKHKIYKNQLFLIEINIEKGFQWQQSDSFLKIYIPFDSYCKFEEIQVRIKEDEFFIQYPTSNNSSYCIQLELWSKIVENESSYEQKEKNIEITLIKREKNIIWPNIQKDILQDQIKQQSNESSQQKQQLPEQNLENQQSDMQQQQIIQPSYPSSSKKKVDWSKIDKELDKELKDVKDDPLQSLFQQIFQNADENTRRAMIKSYQTSGGTVLSTNWNEVQQKDYEGKDRPEAPKGQEYKKYEK